MENYKEKYEQALEKARELMNKGYDVLMPEIFSELQESEDERIKYEIIAFLEQSIHCGGGTPILQEQEDKWLAWLEKQGKQKQTHAELSQQEVTKTSDQEPPDKIEPKKLDADKVIAWLVANILDYEYFVKWFKKDFGL